MFISEDYTYTKTTIFFVKNGQKNGNTGGIVHQENAATTKRSTTKCIKSWIFFNVPTFGISSDIVTRSPYITVERKKGLHTYTF